jgi:hypothetical protein
LPLMLQASSLERLSFSPFSLLQNGLAASYAAIWVTG